MNNVINDEWLTTYLDQKKEEQERRQNLAHEISETFRDQLAEQYLKFNLSSQPMAEITVDPFTPFSHHRQIEEIADIHKWVRPFLKQNKIVTLSLSQPTNAKAKAHGNMWTPPNYATQAKADKQSGKMTGIAHGDHWNSGTAVHTNASLEFDIPALKSDYTTLYILVNYLFDYKLECSANSNSQRQYSQQQVKLNFTVKEFDSIGNDTLRAGLPVNEPLYKYEHQYFYPNVPASIKSEQKSKMYLKRVEVPLVKKHYSYKVIIDLYTYSWIVDGRGANEANFTLIPAM